MRPRLGFIFTDDLHAVVIEEGAFGRPVLPELLDAELLSRPRLDAYELLGIKRRQRTHPRPPLVAVGIAEGPVLTREATRPHFECIWEHVVRDPEVAPLERLLVRKRFHLVREDTSSLPDSPPLGP